MQYQLRDYQITPGQVSQFVEEWREHVLPLRRAAGFEVVGAWWSEGTDRFVWVIAHPADFAEADRAYYDSPERAAVDPNPARLIEEARTEFVAVAG